MVKASSHGGKQPPPAPLIVQGRAVSGTSVRSSGGNGRTTTTTLTSSSSASNAAGGIIKQRGAHNDKKPAGNRPRPSPQSQQQKARHHPPSTQRQSASGRGRPRPSNQNGVGSRSNGTSTSKSSSVDTSRSKNGGQSSTTTAQARSQPPQKAPPMHRQQQNQKRRNANRSQIQSVNENESSTDGSILSTVRNDDDGFEALTWNPFQGDDGIPNHDFWPGGSTQAGLTSNSVVYSVENNQSRSSNTSDASSAVSSAYSIEAGVHISSSGGNKSKLIGESIRSTGKTTRKLAGKLGSKLTSVGAKARGLTQMGDDAFYGAGEAGFSTNIRTITEEEASGAAAGTAVSSSVTSSTASNGNTTIVSVTQRTPQQQPGQRRPSPQSLEGSSQTALNRGVIPTAFAHLASVQNMSTPGGTAVATAQAVPVTATVLGATSVVATTTTLRPPAPVVVGGKVVVKGMAINRSFTGDLKKIEMTVQKYKRIRASAAGSRQGPRAASQSNSQLAESIAELRSCLPKLEALVNRTMLSRTTDANALEKLLLLNDELRLILANLKGEGIKRRINIQDAPTSRSSKLPTAQQARDQHLFKKMREDSNEITAPSAAAKANGIQGPRSANGAGSASANQEPLFHDDPFHGFPEFSNFDDDFETITEDESMNDARRTNGADNEQDRDGLSRLEDEVARLEKQLSGLDPLAKLAMDSILDGEMSHMSNLSITSDGDASADAGFANMEREMMKQLAMGNAWMASEAVGDTPKVTQVKFSQEVTVFEIPNRHQARLAES